MAAPSGHVPVWDGQGRGIAVVEYRGCGVVRQWACYVVADDRLERPRRRRYVPEHQATPPQLHDTLTEAERWAHGRTRALTD